MYLKQNIFYNQCQSCLFILERTWLTCKFDYSYNLLTICKKLWTRIGDFTDVRLSHVTKRVIRMLCRTNNHMTFARHTFKLKTMQALRTTVHHLTQNIAVLVIGANLVFFLFWPCDSWRHMCCYIQCVLRMLKNYHFKSHNLNALGDVLL